MSVRLALVVWGGLIAFGSAPVLGSTSNLRAAIEDLVETFGDRYPRGEEFLAKLDAGVESTELEALRREALIANPLVSGQPILFVVRNQFRNEHGTEATMYQNGEINTPYYPTHAAYYRSNPFGRSPLDQEQLARLGSLVGSAPGGKKFGWTGKVDYASGRFGELIAKYGSPVNFTRPDHSLVLRAFDDRDSGDYRETLNLIRAGAVMLEKHPRPDRPGYQPCEAGLIGPVMLKTARSAD